MDATEEHAGVLDNKPLVTVNDLFEYTGGFGRWQVLVLFLLYTQALTSGMTTFLPVLTQAIPNHQCAIPTLQSPPYNYSVDDIGKTILPSENTTCGQQEVNQCYEYDVDWDVCNGSPQCTTDEINGLVKQSAENDTVYCRNGYSWDLETFTNTVAMEFEFVCTPSGLLSQLLTIVVVFFGCPAGGATGGWVSDTYGRNWSALLHHFGLTLTTLLMALAQSPVFYFCLNFLFGVFSMGEYIPGYVYTYEAVPERWRTITTTAYTGFFAGGQILLALMGYLFRDWRELTFAVVCWCVLFFGFIFIKDTPESLLGRGKVDAAIDAFKRMARLNSKNISEDKLRDMVSNLELEEDQSSTQTSIADLFRHGGGMIRILFSINIVWLCTQICYYGIGYNLNQLPGSVYMNMAISGVAELVACLITPFLIDTWFGRKYIILITLVITAICCATTGIVDNFKTCDDDLNATLDILILAAAYTGKLMNATTYTALYLYIVELFPTVCRSNALGFVSITSYMISSMSIFILALRLYRTWLPGIIFAGISLLGSVVIIWLPETMGIPTLQTYQNANDFYSGKQSVPESEQVGCNNLAAE